jgi:hypothetical protein
LLLAARSAAADPPVPVVKVTVAAAARPAPRALRYPLLPDELDLTPGNAALHWLRAGRAAVAAPALTNKQYEDWLGEAPLRAADRDEARKHLERCRAALRHADRAARCQRCDWEMPPLTVQTFGDFDSQLVDVQAMRALAALLSLESRLQLSDGDYDGAARTIQTGLTLGRHLGQGPSLIMNLVGMALVGVTYGSIERWVATPGSPNLYWSLAALPHPFIDIRPAMRVELAILHRSFPQLRRLSREKLTERQATALAAEIVQAFARLDGADGGLPLDGKLGVSVLAARLYPDAKKALLDAGGKAEDVDALPALQVVLLHLLDVYDRLSDDTLKWAGLPYWQGRAGLEQVQKEMNGALLGPGGFLIGSMLPAVGKVYDAQTRVDRYLATLRCVEALRLHAAAHGGKLPARLADVKEAPPPLDPVTGQGFDAAYKKEDGKAVFEPRPPEGKAYFPTRRFELTEAK